MRGNLKKKYPGPRYDLLATILAIIEPIGYVPRSCYEKREKKIGSAMLTQSTNRFLANQDEQIVGTGNQRF